MSTNFIHNLTKPTPPATMFHAVILAQPAKYPFWKAEFSRIGIKTYIQCQIEVFIGRLNASYAKQNIKSPTLPFFLPSCDQK